MIKRVESDELNALSESDGSHEPSGTMKGSMPVHRIANEGDSLSVNGRLDLPGVKIGLAPAPPCKVWMKFFPSEGGWTAYLLTPAEKRSLVERWLQDFDPYASRTTTEIAPRIMRVEFHKLPEKLAYLLNTIQVHNICLHPQGVATVLVRDGYTTVKAFVQSVLSPGKDQDDVWVREPAELDLPRGIKITARQREALSLAVALGYYEVPHRIGLRELAGKMDMSLGALSGLLRRAESAVLHSFADHFAKTEWRSLERLLANMHRSKNDVGTQDVPVS